MVEWLLGEVLADVSTSMERSSIGLQGMGAPETIRYEPVLSQKILDSVSSVLPSYTPAFLDSLSIASFTCK
jgi:hypothetical protein